MGTRNSMYTVRVLTLVEDAEARHGSVGRVVGGPPAGSRGPDSWRLDRRGGRPAAETRRLREDDSGAGGSIQHHQPQHSGRSQYKDRR